MDVVDQGSTRLDLVPDSEVADPVPEGVVEGEHQWPLAFCRQLGCASGEDGGLT